MKVYQVSREFYPFANAGGLKEVVTGIATALSRCGVSSSVFIPCYGFIDKSQDGFIKKQIFNIVIKKQDVTIETYFTNYKGVDVYLFYFPILFNKNDVYTYTAEDEKNNDNFKKGHGFIDNDLINITFQMAFVEYVTKYLDPPDVLSLHDGHTGLIPGILKSNKKFDLKFKNCKVFFTIHNAGHAYHQRTIAYEIASYGIIEKNILCTACFDGILDPLCLAVLNSHTLTVSPFYAKELLELKHEVSSDEFGAFCNKNGVTIDGIINGVDINHFKHQGIIGLPTFDIKKTYKDELLTSIKGCSLLKVWGDVELNDKPLFIFQNRITEQKGIDKLIESLEDSLLNDNNSCFIVMGQGEGRYEDMLVDLAIKSKKNLCYIQGYDELIAKKLFLASDFFILTSLWEPCGLTDFEAQLAGSIPIVNKTGGLQKVINGKTGFVYTEFSELSQMIYNCEDLFYKNKSKIEDMKLEAYNLIINKYTWDKVLENEYLPLFKGLP